MKTIFLFFPVNTVFVASDTVILLLQHRAVQNVYNFKEGLVLQNEDLAEKIGINTPENGPRQVSCMIRAREP